VAAVLRDGRGSQRDRRRGPARRRAGGGRPPRRPRIATGTLGCVLDVLDPGGGRPPRRPRIATSVLSRTAGGEIMWRPSSATAEDRNTTLQDDLAIQTGVAAVLRDGRGSQLRGTGTGCRQPDRGGRPPRRPRIATWAAVAKELGVSRGGRPPRRPRIATPRLRRGP